MAEFDRGGMTQLGINLMGKAVAGATIQFTKLVLGNGNYSGEIINLTGVVSPIENVDVSRIERDGGSVTLGGDLLTKNVATGFFWSETGLYALDPDLGEILYCYTSCSQPDFVAPSNSGLEQEILVNMVTVVGTNTNISITIEDSMVMVTKKEFAPIKQMVTDMGVSIKEFGAVGDGITDDTIAIQSAINSSNNVYFPDGVYRINTDTPLTLHDNLKLNLHNDCTLKMFNSNQTHYAIIQMTSVKNVVINGGKIIGDRKENTQTTGEWGFGIAAYDCNNIRIENTQIFDCWGDGIYIGTKNQDGYCSNIYIHKVLCSNNRRQGMSVISVDGLWVTESEFSLTNGADPQAGIDLEPNYVGQIIKNVFIDKCIFNDNYNTGLVIHIGVCEGSITVNDCIFSRNGSGIKASGELRNTVATFNNNKIYDSKSNAVFFRGKYATARNIFKFNHTYVKNCNLNGYTSPKWGTYFAVITEPNDIDYTENIGNIEFNDTFIDNEENTTTLGGFFFQHNTGGKVQDITLRNTKVLNVSSAYVYRNNGMVNVVIEDIHKTTLYDCNYSQIYQANSFNSVFTNTNATANRIITLSSSTPVGLKMEVVRTNSIYDLTVLSAEGTTILGYPNGIKTANLGDAIQLEKTDIGWRVISMQGCTRL